MGSGKRLAPAIAVVALTLAVAAPYGLAATPSGEVADRADSGASARRRRQSDSRHGHRSPARLRVLHASPDAGAVDMQVRPTPDGEWRTVATDIGFGEASRYVRLDPGTHDVQLLAAGTEDLVHVVADVVADTGSTQTVNVIGLSAPRAGQAGVRALVLPDGPDAEPEAAVADQTPVVDTDETRADSSSTPLHPRQDRRRRVPDRPAAELERQAPDDQPRVLRQRVQQRQHLQERRFATRLRLRGRRRGLVPADDRQRAGGLLLRVATATRRAQPARRRRRRRPLRPSGWNAACSQAPPTAATTPSG